MIQAPVVQRTPSASPTMYISHPLCQENTIHKENLYCSNLTFPGVLRDTPRINAHTI